MNYHDERLVEIETIETTCFTDRKTGFLVKVEKYSEYVEVWVFDGPYSQNPLTSVLYAREEVEGMEAVEIAARVLG